MLTEAAKATNKSVELGMVHKEKKSYIPSKIKAALKSEGEALKNLNNTNENVAATPLEKETARIQFKAVKSLHQNLVRRHNISEEVSCDNNLHDLLSKEPQDIFKSIRKAKYTQSSKIKSLKVGNKEYIGRKHC